MSLKIHQSLLDNISQEIIANSYIYSSYEEEIHPMFDYLSEFSGKYFWLPIFKMLIKANLLDRELKPSQFMIDNNFAIIGSDVKESGTPGSFEKYYLTNLGYKFIEMLIEEVSWNNLHLAPTGSYSLTILK